MKFYFFEPLTQLKRKSRVWSSSFELVFLCAIELELECIELELATSQLILNQNKAAEPSLQIFLYYGRGNLV